LRLRLDRAGQSRLGEVPARLAGAGEALRPGDYDAVRPYTPSSPHWGYALLLLGFLAGCGVQAIVWTLARMTLKAEARAVHGYADSVAHLCMKLEPRDTAKP